MSPKSLLLRKTKRMKERKKDREIEKTKKHGRGYKIISFCKDIFRGELAGFGQAQS